MCVCVYVEKSERIETEDGSVPIKNYSHISAFYFNCVYDYHSIRKLQWDLFYLL